jgi:hypothetical protein
MVKVTKGLRLYKTAGARRSAVTQMMKTGVNYFTGFRDVCKGHPAGLSYGTVRDNAYCRDIFYKGNHIIH